MNSNALLAAVLAFTFFVFITTRGQLLDYLGTIGLGPRAGAWRSKPPTHFTNGSGGSGGAGGFDLSSFGSNTAQTAADFATVFLA